MQEAQVISEHSTSAIFDDESWIVKTGDNSFELNGKQVRELKKATERNFRGLVWFEGFAISIPHIMSIKRTKRSPEQVKMIGKQYEGKFTKLHSGVGRHDIGL